MSSTSRRAPFTAIVVLALLSTLTKAWIVLAPNHHLLGAGTAEMPNVAVAEEFHRGNVAQEVLDGPLLPLVDYAYAPFFGGSVVVGVVAAPLFAVLGPNVFALKLASILHQALAVACLVLILDRYASRRAAWLGGLLLALPPPGYTAISILAWGSHCEVNALVLLAIWLGMRALEAGRAARWRHLSCGVVCGFSLYYDYASLVGLLALPLAAALAPRAAWARFAPLAFVSGACAGFAPWVLYNARNHFEGLRIYGKTPGGGLSSLDTWLAAPGHVYDLVVSHLPAFATFVFDASLATPLAVVVVLAVIVLAVRAWFVAPPKPASAPFLDPLRVGSAWVVVFVGAYALEKYHAAPERVPTLRYLTPLWPGLACVAAVALDRVAAVRWPRAALVASCAWIVYGGAAWLAATDSSRIGVLWHRPAADPRTLARWTATRFGADGERLAEALERARTTRDRAFQDEYVDGLARTLRWLASDDAELEGYHVARRGEYRASLALLHARAPLEWRERFAPGP